MNRREFRRLVKRPSKDTDYVEWEYVATVARKQAYALAQAKERVRSILDEQA